MLSINSATPACRQAGSNLLNCNRLRLLPRQVKLPSVRRPAARRAEPPGLNEID